MKSKNLLQKKIYGLSGTSQRKLCALNDTVKQMKSKTYGEKILANYVFIKELQPEYINK